jgi:DNA-binding NarL/FixJ family response regulator
VIRVLVAAAYPTVRAGLAAVLRADPGIEVVGEAAGAGELLALVASLQPDVALLELETGQEELTSAVWQVAEEEPGTAIVLLCDATEGWSVEALRAGVRGVLARAANAAEIVAAVVAAGRGLVVLQPAMAQAMLPHEGAAAVAAIAAGSTETLTPRELEVLRLLSEGLGNKGISRKLGISEHTVKFHVGAIMAKLGAASRTEAVTQAARRGLIML